MKKLILYVFLSIISICVLGVYFTSFTPSEPKAQFEKSLKLYNTPDDSIYNKVMILQWGTSGYEYWLEKAFKQGYKPAIEVYEKREADKEARWLAEQKEREEANRKAEEEARKIAEAKERAYDFNFACSNAFKQWSENEIRASNNWTNKKIVISGKVEKIDSRYVQLSGSKWMTLNNLMVETQNGECRMKDLTNNGMNYAAGLNIGDNAKFVCKGNIGGVGHIVTFRNCSEYKY